MNKKKKWHRFIIFFHHCGLHQGSLIWFHYIREKSVSTAHISKTLTTELDFNTKGFLNY